VSARDTSSRHLSAVHARLLRSEFRIRVAMAAQRLDLPFATCVLTADLPDVHDLNLMTVTAAVPPHVLLRSIEKVAETAGWAHRRIEIDDPDLAGPLRMPLLDAGYTEQRMVTMVLTDPPLTDPPLTDPPAIPAAVLDVDAQLALTRATTAEQPWATSSAVVEQFVERERRLARAVGARVVVAPPDEPVSRCLLLSHDGIFEIDAVDTLEAHHRHGWSTAVMHHAIAEATRAGADDIALLADTDDWPRAWYERLGFREAGHSLAYQRTPNG
jgi:GNAT superfamily N-acetyltransferase